MTEIAKSDAPTRVLYLSVLARAVDDAKGRDLMCETPEEEKECVKKAKRWLTKDSFDLRYVCGGAGVEVKEVEKFRGKYGYKSQV